MKVVRRFPVIAATSGSVVLLFSSILGFAASAFWFLDLFNHFRVQYLVASVVGTLVALALGSKPLTLVFTTIALVNAVFIVPFFLPQPKASAPLHEISILSYNTWRHNADWASVRSAIRKLDPDVAYLTETHPAIRSHFQELEADYHIFRQEDDALLIRRRAGLSPKPVALAAGVNLAGIPVILSVEGVEVTLLAIHPAAPTSAGTRLAGWIRAI